jgi:hypothetical protein
MVSLIIEGAPPDGLVIALVNLTGAITPSPVPANTLTVRAGASAKDMTAGAACLSWGHLT